jgi:hypothetical protein
MLRHIYHITLAILLWIVYGYYWSLVAHEAPSPQTRIALILLGILCALVMLILAGWMTHNIRIHRLKARRKQRRPGPQPSMQDYLGRWVVEDDPDRLRSANYIEIEIRQKMVGDEVVEEKVYRSGREALNE